MTDLGMGSGGESAHQHWADGLQLVEPEQFPWLDHRRYAFSLGVRSGDEVWLSGQTASTFDPNAGRVTCGADMTQQATVAWDKVFAVLGGAGLDASHITRVVEYVPAEALARYPLAVGVRQARLGRGDAAPPVATVVIEQLVRPDAMLEVEVLAHGHPDASPLVYLPSLTGRGETLSQQLDSALTVAAELLEPAGLTLANVVKTVDYTTPATRSQYRATAEVRRARLGPDFPAATGVLVGRLHQSGALISIDIVASRQPKVIVDPGWPALRGLTFAPAVRAGSHVFLSGTTALGPHGGGVRSVGDVAGQAQFVYEQLDELVRAAGGRGVADLVKTVEYVAPAGAAGYRGVGQVRQEMLGRPLPAATGAYVAALLQPQWLIEVDALAVVDAADR